MKLYICYYGSFQSLQGQQEELEGCLNLIDLKIPVLETYGLCIRDAYAMALYIWENKLICFEVVLITNLGRHAHPALKICKIKAGNVVALILVPNNRENAFYLKIQMEICYGKMPLRRTWINPEQFEGMDSNDN